MDPLAEYGVHFWARGELIKQICCQGGWTEIALSECPVLLLESRFFSWCCPHVAQAAAIILCWMGEHFNQYEVHAARMSEWNCTSLHLTQRGLLFSRSFLILLQGLLFSVKLKMSVRQFRGQTSQEITLYQRKTTHSLLHTHSLWLLVFLNWGITLSSLPTHFVRINLQLFTPLTAVVLFNCSVYSIWFNTSLFIASVLLLVISILPR